MSDLDQVSRLLFVGAGLYQVQAIENALNNGFICFAVDADANAPVFRFRMVLKWEILGTRIL